MHASSLLEYTCGSADQDPGSKMKMCFIFQILSFFFSPLLSFFIWGALNILWSRKFWTLNHFRSDEGEIKSERAQTRGTAGRNGVGASCIHIQWIEKGLENKQSRHCRVLNLLNCVHDGRLSWRHCRWFPNVWISKCVDAKITHNDFQLKPPKL